MPAAPPPHESTVPPARTNSSTAFTPSFGFPPPAPPPRPPLPPPAPPPPPPPPPPPRPKPLPTPLGRISTSKRDARLPACRSAGSTFVYGIPHVSKSHS